MTRSIDTRLLVFDLDGTILSPDHILLDETRDALRLISDQGIRAALATGRRHESILEFCKDDILQGLHVVADGSFLWDSVEERALAVATISSAEVRKLVSAAERLGITVVLNEVGTSRGAGHLNDIDYMVSYGDPLPSLYTYKDLPVLDTYVQGLLICGRDQSTARENAELLRTLLNGSITFHPSAPGYISCTASGVSKGSGVRLLMKKMGVRADQTISLGDGYNDIPMFHETGISIAIDSSDDAVRSAASMVIPYNKGKGVAQFLTEFVLGHKEWRIR